MCEKIINLFLILVSHIDISQLLVFSTFPEPKFEFNLRIFINFTNMSNFLSL